MPALRSQVSIMFLLGCAVIATSPVRASPPLDFALTQTGRGLTMHKPMYLAPYTYAQEYDGSEAEVVFQISAKHDIFGSNFYAAYTQISFWQAYDRGDSAPFRDTNYNPEIFYRRPATAWGPGWIGADVGFEHESNGQRVPLSRSWNQFYAAPYFHTDNWLAYVKLRSRVPEDDKETPLSPLGDDNPDINDYLGYSDVNFTFLFPSRAQLQFVMRGFLGTDKGNLSLTYSLPIPRADAGFLMVRVFHGYGESLLDYNHSITRYGVGLMISR